MCSKRSVEKEFILIVWGSVVRTLFVGLEGRIDCQAFYIKIKNVGVVILKVFVSLLVR
jgi:hypothetical protein